LPFLTIESKIYMDLKVLHRRLDVYKYIGKGSLEHKWLKALGYRKDPDTIAICVNRLRMGEKPYSLYGYYANDPIVSQDLGVKIGRDFLDGKLNFIEQFPADENERARHDPFRFTRYDIVNEAEEMAPHKWWNLGYIKGLGRSHDEAVELLQEYDRIRETRKEAEVPVTSIQFTDNDGKPLTLPLASPPTMAMRNFRDLPRYLNTLYEMAYMTEYPDAPENWVGRACGLRVGGKLVEKDDRYVVAADNIFRYQVWESQENLGSYFQGLARLSKTRASHEKFVANLIKTWRATDGPEGCGGTDNE
jgi:hypothetical protein